MFIPPAFERYIAYCTPNKPLIGTAYVYEHPEPVDVTATFVLEEDLEAYLKKYGGKHALYSYTNNIYIPVNVANRPSFSMGASASHTAQLL